MRSSKWCAVAVLSSLPVVASAARVDFKDPRRAVGREDNVRVDAQLASDTLSPTTPLTITYQIENLSKSTVAIADKVADADYDPDSGTITFSVGAEVPNGNTMPHMVMIKSGEKRTLTSGTFPHFAVPRMRTAAMATPRYVEIRVTLLRDVSSFASLIERQNESATPLPFPNDLFDRWVEGSSSVDLNTIPIRWRADRPTNDAESARPSDGGMF